MHRRPILVWLTRSWFAIAALGFTVPILKAVEPPVTAIAVAPEGDRVVVGSQAGVFVAQLPGFRQQVPLRSDQIEVHAIAFSPSGQHVAVAGGVPGEQGTVELFSWPELRFEQRMYGHADTIESIAWKDEQTLATGSLDHEIFIWDLKSSKPLRQLRGHSKGVTTLAFLSSGEQLLSGSIDQNVRLWDVESGELVRTLNNHTRTIHDACLRPGSDSLPMVATVSDDRTVRLWQPTIGRMVRFCRLESTPLAVDWIDEGRNLVVACQDGMVRLIDPETAEVREASKALIGWAYVLQGHPRVKGVVVGGSNGELKQVSFDD